MTKLFINQVGIIYVRETIHDIMHTIDLDFLKLTYAHKTPNLKKRTIFINTKSIITIEDSKNDEF